MIAIRYIGPIRYIDVSLGWNSYIICGEAEGIIDSYKSTITFVRLYFNIHIKFNGPSLVIKRDAQIIICIQSEVRKYI